MVGTGLYLVSGAFRVSGAALGNLSATPRSIALWVRPRAVNVWDRLLQKRSPHPGNIGWNLIQVASPSGAIGMDQSFSGGNAFRRTDGSVLIADEWNHIVVTYDPSSPANDPSFFVNGELRSSTELATPAGVVESDIAEDLYFGRQPNGWDQYEGGIDEIALWSRALTSSEIRQLYRRGANRVKYQVKSCVDSSCNCKSYNTSPAGSASDCDGDGTPNSSDTDDIYMAEFIGPGGDGSTQYSELFNRAPSDLTFNCSANTSDSDDDVCVDDEITLEGDTNATSPSFTFADMATSAAPANNRYFQYRVLMEAEDNTACSGEPCLPELTSVEVGPTGRYYGGSPVVSSNSPLSFDNIQSMSFSEGGWCSHSYQLSPDGSTYYYFDGTNWVTAGSETVGLSSSSSQITSNISSFVDTAGTGNLYFKAFLNSDTSQSCTVDNISLTKEVE